MTLSIEQLRNAVTNSGIVSQLSDEAVAPATNLTSLLESVVKRDKEEASKREKLQATLAEAIPSIDNLEATPQEFANEVKRFIGNAKDAYRRIGTTAASIASGEAKAIGANMLGPLEFGKKGNQRFLTREVAIRTGPKMKVRVLTLKTHVDDLKDAIVFLKEQMQLVAGDNDSGLNFDKIRFEKVVKRSKGFDIGPANEYIIKTKAYLGFLMEPTLLETSIAALNESMGEFPSPTDIKEDRVWAHQLIKGLCDFGKFLTGFAAAESDLLKLEGVEGLGQMQEAALTMLRNVIITDQRMYPSNNQIPVPPPPSPGRSLPDINGFFEAYEKRQEMLANAANADIVNKANAAFDRRIAFAMKQTLTLSSPKYAYVPRPSSEIYSEMVRKGKFSSTGAPIAEARVLMPAASEAEVSTLGDVEDAYRDFDKSDPDVDFDDLD